MVLALHKCFLFDQGGFLDEPLFNRLVNPLVAQLSFHFPVDVAARELNPQQLSSSQEAAEGLDVFGLAAVEAVVQMAVSLRAEAMWKPLHHQVILQAHRAILYLIFRFLGRLHFLCQNLLRAMHRKQP